MSWPKSPSETNARRAALKASLALSACSQISFDAEVELASIFGNPSLTGLAQKIASALPRETRVAVLNHLNSGLAKLTTHQQPDLLLSLKLLHGEDLAAGRVHALHGLFFSLTQLGYLVFEAQRQKDDIA